MRRVTVGILAVGFAVAIATGACRSDASDPSVAANETSSASDTLGVRHVLRTHCGVLSTTYGGNLWIAEPQRPDGFDDPLTGWGENETVGRLVVNGSSAEFTAESGVSATFRMARAGETDPATGCE